MAVETPTSDAVHAGQWVYTPRLLKLYDLWVIRVQNRLFWRCSSWDVLALYDAHVSARHLDIGVGTGFFLDQARFPVADPAITLFDLNANCLKTASRRLARYAPETVHADALQPFPEIGPFDSASMSLVLHCMPGPMRVKAAVFDHLKPCLAPGATVFGATTVQGDAPRSWAARKLMNLYNAKGIFSNADDTAENLGEALAARFDDVHVQLHGCMALFSARR